MISEDIRADEVADALGYMVQTGDSEAVVTFLNSLGKEALESVAQIVGVENERQDHEADHLIVETMKFLKDW